MTWGLANDALAQGAAPAASSAPPGAAPSAAPAKPAAAAPTAPAEGTAPPAEPAAAAEAASAPSASASSGGGLFESSQDSADSGSAEEASGGLPFDFNGYIRGDAFVGKVPTKGAAEMKAAYGELSLKIATKKFKYGDAFAETRFRYGLQQGSRIQLVDLREAYVNLYAGPLDLRLGQQVIVWGRADAVNPTNNLTPVDLRVHSPNEDDRRLGNLAARAYLNFQPIRIEGVWVPLFTPSELPITLPAGASFSTPSYPSPDIKNGTEALRVHLELPSVEMSVSYLYGYAPLPGLEYAGEYTTGGDVSAGFADAAGVKIRRAAYNQHVVGGDFSTTLFDWLGVRGEAAWRMPLHYSHKDYAPKPDVMGVLGLDHTFDNVSVITQYIGKYTVKWRPPPPPGGSNLSTLEDATGTFPDTGHDAVLDKNVAAAVPAALYPHNQQIFGQEKHMQHMASLRVEWLALHQTLSLSALGLLNFSTGEWVAFPKLAYQFGDSLTGTIGAELYQGPHDTLFGSISSQLSTVYTELKFSY